MPALKWVGDALPWAVRASKQCATESCIANWKIIFAIILVVESLIFGHIVLLLRVFACVSPARFMSVMRYGNAVAGGIFLATGLLHVVPEAIALYEQGDKPVGAHPPGVSTSAPTSAAHAGHNHGAHGHSVQFPAVFSIILASFYAMLIVEHLLISVCQRKAVDEEEDIPYDPDRSESLDLALYGHTSMNLTSNFAADRRRRAEDVSEQAGIGYISRAFMSCLVITAGVGAHSILEAITLGAATKFSDVLNLFLATIAHRWATSAALGIRYAKANLSDGPVILLVFLFSFIAPIGVGFGFLTVDTNPKVQGVLFALGAGTFLYLGSVATLEHNAWRNSAPLRLYIASAVGAASMLVVTAILVKYELH